MTSTTRPVALLSLGALGVVFGDIGTSPLYTLKACFSPDYGITATRANVTGVISLIIWTLTLVVGVKYAIFIMRADNHGEGGIFALLALILPARRQAQSTRRTRALVMLGLAGAALLYGDGVITPAISVLSAVEGIKVATPAFGHLVVPVALAILVMLFTAQRFGTDRIGAVFGPLMLLWFVTIAILGALEIVKTPAILDALNPVAGLRFLAVHGTHALLVLGAVVLAVTGAEALYADMGHFGRTAIRLAWLVVVFPSLLLSYLGQGALLIRSPSAVSFPFFLQAPAVMLVPLVLLATLATIVASQALISGAFSLTQQAMQLGFSPRLHVKHTSAELEGQIYMPFVNMVLMVACLLLVVGFESSDRLASAYGIAVTGTMAATTVLFYEVARAQWGWSALRAGALSGLFLLIDLTFFGANLLKFSDGGWVPLSFASVVFLLMTTWRAGHARLVQIRREHGRPFETVYEDLDSGKVVRVPGTAVFFTSHVEGVPPLILRQMKQLKVLPEVVVVLAISTIGVPVVPAAEALKVETLTHGFVRATAHVGFMERPDAARIVDGLRECGAVPAGDLVYFTPNERVTPTGTGHMFRWRKDLFCFMARNVGSLADAFNVPPDKAIELGAEIEI